MYSLKDGKAEFKKYIPQPTTPKTESTVLKLYKPLLFLVKSCGNFPLTLILTSSGSKGHLKDGRFDFKLLSWKTFYALFTNLGVYTSMFGVMESYYFGKWDSIPQAIKRGKSIQWEDRSLNSTSTVGSLMSIGFDYLIPWNTILSMLLLTCCCKSLGTFVLGWKEFEENFRETFDLDSSKRDPFRSLKKIRNITLGLYLSFGILPHATAILLQFRSTVHAGSTQAVIFLITVTFAQLPSFGTVLRDCYSVLMFKTVALAYKEVNSGIKSSSVWNCSRDDVERWTRLVDNIRTQITRMESTLEVFGIVEIFFAGYLWLATFFHFYDWFSKHQGNFEFVVALLLLSLWYLTYLAIKTTIADQIGHEEKLLGNTILLKSSQQVDIYSRLEMKFLHDIISDSPARIKVGNLFAFEKGLILKILSHVVTYLVVLIQFDGSSNQS